MMRFVPLALLWGFAAWADQLQAVMPVPLAARIVAGPTWDGVVTSEPLGGGRVLVTVEARWHRMPGESAVPLQSRGPVPPEATIVQHPLVLPAELRGLRQAGAWETLVQTVLWVSQNVRLREDDRDRQDAASVLRRRVGRCSGRANLAVALLRQLGIPARVVHGLFVRADGAVWHRWGEAWIEGIGWRPFDPGVAVGAVGVRYLPMTGAEEKLSLDGVKVMSVAEWEFYHLPRVCGMRVPPSLLRDPSVALGEREIR